MKSREDMRQYFSISNSRLQNLIVKQMVSEPVDRIRQELLNGHFNISCKHKPFQVLRKPIQDRQLEQILVKKEAVKKQLSSLLGAEENLKQSQLLLRRSRVSRRKLLKSQLSNQDAQHLKILVQQKKKFDRKLQQKTEKIEEAIRQCKQRVNSERDQRITQQHQQRKQYAKQKLEIMQIRREEQQRKFAEENKTLKQIISRKKMQRGLSQKWGSIEEQEKQKLQELAEQLKKSRRVNFEEIKQHSRKCDEAIRNQQESRVKMMKSRLVTSKSHYHSLFLDSVLEEEQQRKQEMSAQVSRRYQYLERMNEYGEEVRVKFKPHTKVTESQDDVLEPIKPLNSEQMHQKGVEYLRKLRQINKRNSGSQKQKENRVQTEVKQHRFKNYMREFHLKLAKNKVKKSEKQQLQRILDDPDMSQEEKIFHSKMLAERIDRRCLKQTDSNLIKSAKLKLEILNKIA